MIFVVPRCKAFLFLSLFALCALFAFKPAHAAEDKSEQPNIVVFYADDWRFDTLSCAGNAVVKTPTIDQLAKEGVRFTNNYVTTSICGISRATLYTGQWMARHGCRGFSPFKTAWEETYPGLLRENGYWLGHVGKWHNGKFPADKYDYSRVYHGRHYYPEPDGSKIHVTKKNERDALQFLNDRPKDKPFCLNLCFFATHAEDGHPEQYLPQPESKELYKEQTVPVPPTATEEAYHLLPPFVGNEKNEGRNRYHWRFDTPAKFQKYMKNYYRLATEVDSTCSRVLEELKKQGVLENTVVLFTTDNGYFHAEHGLADKWYPYEESIRVPLVLRDFRTPAKSEVQTSEAMTLSVDLAPTILSYAGIAAPKRMQGRDLSPLYKDQQAPADWRTEFFYEHPTHRSIDFIPSSEALVRTDFKYVYWPDYEYEEMFDLTKDPGEVENLVNSPQHAERLAEMRAQFLKLKEAAK